MKEVKIQSDNANSLEAEVKAEENEEDPFVKSSPFKLEWIFGFNSDVRLINLTAESSSKMFAVTSGHAFQIFRCDDNSMQSFVGHESEVFVLETDATGRFIVSADISGIINVWDTSLASKFPHPVRTIYEPYSREHQRKLTKVALSVDGRNILTSSDGKGSYIKLWQWSFNSAEASNDSFELPLKYDEVENIRFSSDESCASMFIVTTKNGIAFGQWDRKHQQLQRHYPARAISINFQFTDAIFIESSHKAMSITTCGSVVVWSDVISLTEDAESDIASSNFKKEFIKSVKLSENSLHVISSIDGFVMICDSLGQIRFYDKELKILFWCPSHDSIDSIVSISFDLKKKLETLEGDEDDASVIKAISIRDFFVQTRSDIFSVNVSQMKFNRIFYKSDDFITAIDVHPLNRNLICCGNYSGRIFIYDFERKTQIVENRLKLRKRKSSTSDTETIRTPHISVISFSPDGFHLVCGLSIGSLVLLDPNVLHELKCIHLNHQPIVALKFSPDSSFISIYDSASVVSLLHLEEPGQEWRLLGRVRYHTKAICDILFIPAASTKVSSSNLLCPRLISLAQDRQIVEYDLTESMRLSRSLSITFVKRIFQTSLPVSMTLIHNNKKGEDQLLIADTKMKFKLFDKNTFEILATFLGPIYDSYVERFDASASFGPTLHSKFFIFTTSKHICLYALPIDGNPFRSLGVVGHSNGVRNVKSDFNRRLLFTIGNKCHSLFMWNINSRPLFDHLEEGGAWLKPFCDLLPGGKFGFFFQQMQNLFFYMLLIKNKNTLDARTVKEGLDINEVPDFMRALGFYPSDYEIECLHHELEIDGRRKIPFEDLVKLYVNHSHASFNGSQQNSLELALRSLFASSPEADSANIIINKSRLVAMLTESGEKIEVKDAEIQLKQFFSSSEEISLKEFIHRISKISSFG